MAISAKTAMSTITPKVLSGPKNDAALKLVLLRYLYPRNATKTAVTRAAICSIKPMTK